MVQHRRIKELIVRADTNGIKEREHQLQPQKDEMVARSERHLPSHELCVNQEQRDDRSG
jgi:hypothetical protein